MSFWKPYPKQEFALKKVAFEILFGGSRGPGKTDTGIVWMCKPIANPKYRGLVIRKNADDLRDWIDRARRMYFGLGAEVVGKPAEIRFPSGAKIVTGHLKDDNAYEKYQGHEYQRMLIEELTQIPDEERYLRLISSCRSTVDGLDPRVFCTTNPLGPGHVWVKKRFVDPAPAMEKFKDKETGRTRIFIPATIDDNPTLLEKDPEYRNFLNGLPSELRAAWRDGSWDVMVGMFFDNFDRKLTVYNPADVKILPTWKRFRSVDWGYSSPMAVLWHAVGPDKHIYTYREWYKTNYLDVDAAREINEISKMYDDETKSWVPENIEYTVGDPQSFPVKIAHYKFGQIQSVARYEVWAEQGIPMIMGDSARIQGWSRMREYLQPRDYKGEEVTYWHISNTCVNLIEELSTAIRDKNKPEDVTDCKDHAIESARLGLMSRPPIFEEKKFYTSHLQAAEAQMKREEEGYDEII